MNLLNDWISENLLYALGWTLVHSIWQLIVASVVFWILLRLFKRRSPSFNYRIGLGALGVSLLLSCGTFIYELSSFESTSLAEKVAFSQVAYQDLSLWSSSLEPALLTNASNWIDPQLPLLVNFWFLGALLFLFRLFNNLSEIRTLRKSSTESADFEIEKKLYRLMGKMEIDRKVSLYLTSFGTGPITFGFVKPVILIPAALVFQLSSNQLEAIIAHELAHVKRNDYLANLFQSTLEILYFYHPCYWWINQSVKELRENAADDLAVKAGVAPKELAYGLAEVVNFAKQNPPELALAAGKKRSPTLQRIKRILGHPAQIYPQTSIISIPMLLTLLLSAGLMASAHQDVPDTLSSFTSLSENVHNELPTHQSIVRTDTVYKKTEKHVISNTNGGKTFKYEMHGDTVIVDGDTLLMTGNSNISYPGQPVLDFGTMPKLELPPTPPAPPFPPVVPVPPFPLAEMAEMPPFPTEPMPAMDPTVFKVDSLGMGMFIFPDTVRMTKSEKETWTKNMEKRSEELAKKSEEWVAKWADEESGFQAKMAEWQKKMEPRVKEFEAKMQEWQKTQEPKMKEFEAKMKAWEQENQPKIEEFQRKMEIWQKENQLKMEELQKKLQEQMEKLKSENDN